jgi:hypothetical protein
LSPSQDIALVHNGVIYNHQEVRFKIDGDLPDVDTSVIPAVIEQLGVDSLDVLDGDAAIAWFNRNEANTLHLARFQHSPLVMCQIEDGSFIFASTEKLLWEVLVQLDLMPTWMETAKELDYFTIRDGIVLSSSRLPEPKHYNNYYDYNYYRHQTAGAKSSSTTSGATYNIYGSQYVEGYGWSEWDDFGEEDDRYFYAESSSDNVNNNRVISIPEYEDGYEDNIIPFTKPDISRGKWYTRILEHGEEQTDLLVYNEGQVEQWKDELYLLSDSRSNMTVIDYGVIRRDGTLVSATEDIF